MHARTSAGSKTPVDGGWCVMPDDRVVRILARLGNGGAGRATTRLCAVCAEVTDMSGAGIMLLADDRPQGSLCTTNDVERVDRGVAVHAG